MPGANFISSVDRTLLGAHALVGGPHGYDPEGLLSTFPAIAQCLLGAAAGEWFLNNRARKGALARIALAGVALLLVGVVWSAFFPS